MMLTPDQFRESIEAFLEASNMTATRFGIEAVRDPNFVHDVRKGRVPSLSVAGNVIRFMGDHTAGPKAHRVAAPSSLPQVVSPAGA
jgi:hypothetical protein